MNISRLPRKLKKLRKKQESQKSAVRLMAVAINTAMRAMQIAEIISRPTPRVHAAPLKAYSLIDVAVDAANSIQSAMTMPVKVGPKLPHKKRVACGWTR